MITYQEALEREKQAPDMFQYASAMRRLGKALPPSDRAVFYLGVIRAAELCGKHTFARELALSMCVDPWAHEEDYE